MQQLGQLDQFHKLKEIKIGLDKELAKLLCKGQESKCSGFAGQKVSVAFTDGKEANEHGYVE